MEKETKIINGNRIFLHHRIASAVRKEEFVSDRISYIVLRGCLYNITVLNVHVTSEEKSDDSKESVMRNLIRFSIIFLSTIWHFC
jgi:hypothetical protein